MPKLRKMLGNWQQPEIRLLMKLIETQSKATLTKWCISYAQQFMLPIYNKMYPSDVRPQSALQAARDWLDNKIKLPEAKQLILDCHAAAREAENNPAACAAARAVGQAASCIHTATHSLGIAFYGAAAVAYQKAGLNANSAVYDKIATEEFIKIEKLLKKVAIKNEPNPAKINWNC